MLAVKFQGRAPHRMGLSPLSEIAPSRQDLCQVEECACSVSEANVDVGVEAARAIQHEALPGHPYQGAPRSTPWAGPGLCAAGQAPVPAGATHARSELVTST